MYIWCYKFKKLIGALLAAGFAVFVLSYSIETKAKDINSKVSFGKEDAASENELENEINELVKVNAKKQNKDAREQVMEIDRRINTESAITFKDYKKPLTKDELAIKHSYNKMISNENGLEVIVSRDESSQQSSNNEVALASNFANGKEDLIEKEEQRDHAAEAYIKKAYETKKLNKNQKLKVIKKEIQKKNEQEERAKRRKKTNTGTSSLSNSFNN